MPADAADDEDLDQLYFSAISYFRAAITGASVAILGKTAQPVNDANDALYGSVVQAYWANRAARRMERLQKLTFGAFVASATATAVLAVVTIAVHLW